MIIQLLILKIQLNRILFLDALLLILVYIFCQVDILFTNNFKENSILIITFLGLNNKLKKTNEFIVNYYKL